MCPVHTVKYDPGSLKQMLSSKLCLLKAWKRCCLYFSVVVNCCAKSKYNDMLRYSRTEEISPRQGIFRLFIFVYGVDNFWLSKTLSVSFYNFLICRERPLGIWRVHLPKGSPDFLTVRSIRRGPDSSIMGPCTFPWTFNRCIDSSA